MNQPKCAKDEPVHRNLTELLIKQARDIKMLPTIAVKAIAIADDPDSSIQEFANIIAQDFNLSSNILALANSPIFPIYATGRPLGCLKMAVTRLGFRQTKQMILVSCYSSMVQNLKWKEIQVREQLGQHGFLTGVISSNLNKLLKLGMQGEEFTAGLFHDVGRVLLAVTIPDEFEKFDQLDFVEDEGILEREQAAIGRDHAEVGAWFLRRNQLSDDLVSVARYHHCPEEATKYSRLVAMVSLADDLSNFYFRKNSDDSFVSSTLTSLKLLEKLGVENAISILDKNWEELLSQSVSEFKEFTSLK